MEMQSIKKSVGLKLFRYEFFYEWGIFVKKFSVFTIVTLSVWGSVGLQGCRPNDDQQGKSSEINQLKASDYPEGGAQLVIFPSMWKLKGALELVSRAYEARCIGKSQFESLSYQHADCAPASGGPPESTGTGNTNGYNGSACKIFVDKFNALEGPMRQCLANKNKPK